MKTVPVELVTTKSNYEFFGPTALPYNRVVALYTPNTSVISPAQPNVGEELFTTHHLREDDAETLAAFYKDYVACHDPEAWSSATVQSEQYLCHTLPLFMMGVRPRDNAQATTIVRGLSATYVPLPQGADVPPGVHGVVRRRSAEDGARGKLLHSFFTLGNAACVQVFNFYGNMGVSTIAEAEAQYGFIGQTEVAVPAAALALAA